LLVGSIISGFANGLIKSLFSLAGLIIGVIVAGRYYTAFAGYLSFIPNENAARIVAFIIIFLAIAVICGLLGTFFSKLISVIQLGGLNRLLGAVFGLILGAIFIAAMLALWVKYGGANSAIVQSSIAIFLLDRLPFIMGLLPQEFDTVRQFFS
jgi:membrane protein required for colicin V production